MPELKYSVVRLPDAWPGKPTLYRNRPPFKTRPWSELLRVLAREVSMVSGRDVTIAVDVSEMHIRGDGQLRADARARAPAVILAFRNGKGDRFEFPCEAKTEATMTTAAAAALIAQIAGVDSNAIVTNSDRAIAAVRLARAKTHPDGGGSSEQFAAVGMAKKSLESHFGRAF